MGLPDEGIRALDRHSTQLRHYPTEARMGLTHSADTGEEASSRGNGFWALTLGSIGVVYGDIGTSPLYAFREALHAATEGGRLMSQEAVLGVISLILWALIVIVTLKYVLLLLRAD